MSVYAPERFEPPEEYRHHRWHWVETEFGAMCASWYPNASVDGCGSWDISGHYKSADDPKVRREWEYLGPAIPPAETKEPESMKDNTLRRMERKLESLRQAIATIRDMPMQEQDNMISANMRRVAAKALEKASDDAQDDLDKA